MTTTAQLAQTPLHDWHKAHGGRMVDFAGWSMPVQYASIVEEHQATRTAVGLFDISHMGRLRITGPDATKFLDCMLTRGVADMRPGQIRYSLVCNAEGGILDDVLAYYLGRQSLGKQHGDHAFSLVVNASNREKIVDWLNDRITEFAARLEDETTKTAMIAVQGPEAVAILDGITDGALGQLKYYRGIPCQIAGQECYVSRTGYTGEDGGEIVCSTEQAPQIWEQLMAKAQSAGGSACGLGARDTLRLEAAMPLYGHELSEEINPIAAGLQFAVSLGKGALGERDFIGRDAIEKFLADPAQPVRVGLQLDGRRVAREGAAVLHCGNQAGQITSGTFSPTLQKPIAMAYVPSASSAIGTSLEVDIRGKTVPATVAPLPFYKRS